MTVGSQLKQTIVSLKGIQGTAKVYATQAQHEKTRRAFSQASDKLEQILSDLEGRLQTLEFEEPQYKG
ncbi:DUF1657 domain-containing protein [Dethiobacter alkaliphilus]|uniref:DUF1657 domain-containing protein n=1 Tax=Dethiobacter alkaliphilus AHT 1 TaxID=555088 RepID=C0GC44_DETAL|nr:DUF1657 domain-containing protein [Dethiobacter alkaliphilus]EEG78779.1 protein of unknown function DUF1657 [Dethiobacter alkaliphilus AHT 1]